MRRYSCVIVRNIVFSQLLPLFQIVFSYAGWAVEDRAKYALIYAEAYTLGAPPLTLTTKARAHRFLDEQRAAGKEGNCYVIFTRTFIFAVDDEIVFLFSKWKLRLRGSRTATQKIFTNKRWLKMCRRAPCCRASTRSSFCSILPVAQLVMKVGLVSVMFCFYVVLNRTCSKLFL